MHYKDSNIYDFMYIKIIIIFRPSKENKVCVYIMCVYPEVFSVCYNYLVCDVNYTHTKYISKPPVLQFFCTHFPQEIFIYSGITGPGPCDNTAIFFIELNTK